MATESLAQPASRLENGIRITKNVGLLRRQATAEFTVDSSTLYFHTDAEQLTSWGRKVLATLPPGFIEDHGIPEALKNARLERFEFRRQLETLPDTLVDGEVVHSLQRCTSDDDSGLLIITDRRVRFLPTSFSKAHVKEVLIDSDIEVNTRSGLHAWLTDSQTTAVIEGPIGRIQIKTNEKSDIDKIRHTLNAIVASKQQPATPHVAPPTQLQVDEIVKLAELHRQGILTDEEFATAKGRILGL